MSHYEVRAAGQVLKSGPFARRHDSVLEAAVAAVRALGHRLGDVQVWGPICDFDGAHWLVYASTATRNADADGTQALATVHMTERAKVTADRLHRAWLAKSGGLAPDQVEPEQHEAFVHQIANDMGCSAGDLRDLLCDWGSYTSMRAQLP